ncbi:MAG: hypothetical protein K0S14_447 [Thermomicrobiales bacterium]|jgi:uncharacterized protein YraI|nr:hypothetical protein [Thermomicrobiales bacterium]MCD6057268.1 hypothetical protein [Thermomicrobiales bacterium]
MRLLKAHIGPGEGATAVSKWVSGCLCAIVALVALIGAALVDPVPVLAASGTLRTETPLLDAPGPATPVITVLPAGTAVSIDGPPVDGFYPVTAENLSGWIGGEALHIEKDTLESGVAEDMHADPLLNDTDEIVPVEDLNALDPSADTSAAPGQAPHTAEPTMDSNVMPIPAAEGSSVGPASVMVDAPILAGPGPEYGFIATAPAGSTVEQTGHLINGYVTVQHAEVTGWVALEHLGASGAYVEATTPEETAAPIESLPADAPPVETSPTKTASSETSLAEPAPIETAASETAPVEAAPVAAP